VKNDSHTTSTGHSTHQDSIKKILPAPLFFESSLACGALFSQQIFAYSTFFCIKNLVCGAFNFSVLFGLPIHWF